MNRRMLFTILIAFCVFKIIHYFAQSPGSLGEALSNPFRTIMGTSAELNARLIEVSESPVSIRDAGRRLLQPLGVVRLVKIYDSSDTDPAKIDPPKNP